MQLLNEGDRYVIESDGLLIKNIIQEDSGTYTCRARVAETGNLEERDIRLEVTICKTQLSRQTLFTNSHQVYFPSNKNMIMKMLLNSEEKESRGIIRKGHVQAESPIIHPSITKLTEMEKDGQISSAPRNRSPNNLTSDSKDFGR